MPEPRRFVSVEFNALRTWGAIIGTRFHDLGPTGAGFATDLMTTVGALPSISAIKATPFRSTEGLTYLPVIPAPGKIICIGVNYAAHQEESGGSRPRAPIVFTRFADSQIGHLAGAVHPRETEMFDYEGEIAIVIAKEARRAEKASAWSLVAGLAPYNDFSVRDWQRHSSQWIPGKNWPATGAFGPVLVPPEDLLALEATTLTTRVNGEIRQHTSIADMTFSIPEVIEYVSTFTPLSAGDVIVTGTPGGVGLFMDPPAFLAPGDVVEVEVSGVGTLRNEVVAE